MTTNLYEISRWKLTLWTRNRKFTWSTGSGYQEGNWWYPVSCWTHAKENIFNLFDILKKKWQYYTNVGLYYHRCLQIWMVKIWWIFGQSSSQIHQIFAPPNFPSVWYLFVLKWSFIFNLRKTGTAKTGPAGLFRRPCSLKINLSCTVQKSTQTSE